MAGYSKRSLVEKLGIKESMHIAIINAPDNYAETLEKLPKNLTIDNNLGEKYNFIQFFAKSQETVKEKFPVLKKALIKNGSLWIAWPKGTCNIATDLNENIIRKIGLANGLVDIKVIAVDDMWSGLKFVYRLSDRT